MALVPTWLAWLLWAFGVIVLYETVRSSIVVAWRRRHERRIDAFLRENQIPTDPFRHMHRIVVKEIVMADAGLATAVEEEADRRGVPPGQLRARVQHWLDEIVPQFNLLAYYRVGYRLGRLFAYGLYHVKLDEASWRRAQAAIPEGASMVLVSNHRSNADFVVTGFMVSKSVQVSYAVGEWARVWPLEHLFRSFGSYFVRRGEKDPLYHRTLEAYLQLITKQGVTQAVFPEGGLSRDGAMRPPKLGLLDMMTRAKLDPTFTRPLVFVPVGINFDRVLEDENLVSEHLGLHPYHAPGPLAKAGRLVRMLGRSVWAIPVQSVRFATKRMKKHGVAAIHFGSPVTFDDWYAGQEPFLDAPERRQRWESLQPFAHTLMQRIQRAIPVTPATLVCAGAHGLGQEAMAAGVDKAALLGAMRQVIEQARLDGRPLALGDPYQHGERALQLPGIDDQLDLAETLDKALAWGLDVTAHRGIVFEQAGRYHSKAGRWPLVAYYANSIRG